jgi:hypothetical protein
MDKPGVGISVGRRCAAAKVLGASEVAVEHGDAFAADHDPELIGAGHGTARITEVFGDLLAPPRVLLLQVDPFLFGEDKETAGFRESVHWAFPGGAQELHLRAGEKGKFFLPEPLAQDPAPAARLPSPAH